MITVEFFDGIELLIDELVKPHSFFNEMIKTRSDFARHFHVLAFINLQFFQIFETVKCDF